MPKTIKKKCLRCHKSQIQVNSTWSIIYNIKTMRLKYEFY